jgi:hypothetical protein
MMDQRRFDALTRACAQLLDRREGLAAALALPLAALMPGAASAAKKHRRGGKGHGGKGGGHKNKHKHKRKHRRKQKNRKKHHKKKKQRGESGPRNCDNLPLTQGADLANCDLRQHPGLASADFTNAKLEDTIISGATLSGISFRGARLWRAKLDGANLSNANFNNSGDQRTDIFGVDFSNANLNGATLDFNDVLYANYAIFCHTTMPNGAVNDDDC